MAPKHPQTLVSSGKISVATANTNRDGTGTITTVLAGTANGTIIQRVNCCAVGTTTSGFLRFWVYDGTNHCLLFEVPVEAITPSLAVVGSLPARPVWTYTWQGSISLISTSYIFKVSTHVAETFNVIAEGFSY